MRSGRTLRAEGCSCSAFSSAENTDLSWTPKRMLFGDMSGDGLNFSAEFHLPFRFVEYDKTYLCARCLPGRESRGRAGPAAKTLVAIACSMPCRGRAAGIRYNLDPEARRLNIDVCPEDQLYESDPALDVGDLFQGVQRDRWIQDTWRWLLRYRNR